MEPVLSLAIQVLVGLLYFFSEERMQDPYEAVGTDVLAKEPYGGGNCLEIFGEIRLAKIGYPIFQPLGSGL
jgi:hypothetical protein